ncbi:MULTISPECIES: WD40/YVTN/BNR-like repeat-containing protein [unclassified Marinobacter]|uniref:WD40/YVTN/BNR-like repeat-containing protein n=1 Tax=unclassified Marinobacter TaxID=83889 RepID=UPI0018F240CC|nr:MULTISPECIES: glycosyl hydrolase [unclassified Marinobacter]
MQEAPMRSLRTSGVALVFTSATTLLLTGCEAPLNLEAVRSIENQPTKRTDFYQAMASNRNTIVVAGNDGALLSSSDQGKSWKRQPEITGSSFLSITSCPDQSFIALSFDNTVWHGDASAKNWVKHALPSQEQMMTVACSPDGKWLTAGSFTTFQHSADQGESWNEASLYEDAIINNLQFINQDQAIATGEYGLVLKSEDGGENWDIAGYAPDEFYVHTSYFEDADNGWIGGLNGFIYQTNDGGQNWEQMSTATNAPIFGFIAGDTSLYALADNATVLQLQQDIWNKISESEQPLYLRAGLALPDQRLLVAGGRGLLFDIKPQTALAASTD